jgi:hemoglobin-like flavoprotein
MAAFAHAALIVESLETAAARGGDLTAVVYARLFAQFPETEPLFALDSDGAVRGAMLTHVFDTILHFIGERRYAHRFIESEIVTHEGYNVPRDAFASFFGVVRDEVQAACGPEWTNELGKAWVQLLADLARYVSAR